MGEQEALFDLTPDENKGVIEETEIESYVVGGIKQDVTSDTFKGFKL